MRDLDAVLTADDAPAEPLTRDRAIAVLCDLGVIYLPEAR